MAQQQVDLGTGPDSGDGDPARTAFGKVNNNASDSETRLTNLENNVNQNVTTTGTPSFTSVNGRDVATDGVKLDGIENGAEVNPTAAEIKTEYESNSDTNAFTDADESKLDGLIQGDITEFSQYKVGTTADPNTIATTSGTAPTLAQMTHTFTPDDASNRIDVLFSGSFENDEKKGESISCGIFIDNTLEAETERQAFTPGRDEQVAIATFWSGTLPASSTTIDIRYWGSDGTTTATGILRNFKVTEIKEGG